MVVDQMAEIVVEGVTSTRFISVNYIYHLGLMNTISVILIISFLTFTCHYYCTFLLYDKQKVQIITLFVSVKKEEWVRNTKLSDNELDNMR